MADPQWKKFEDLVKKSSDELCGDFMRNNSSGVIKMGDDEMRLKSICDCQVFDKGILAYVECKSYEGSIRFEDCTETEKYKERKTKGRLERLLGKWRPEKLVVSGYICEFQSNNSVWFIPSVELEKMERVMLKASFSHSDVLHYGIMVDKITPKGKRSPRLNMPKLIVDLFGKYIKAPS